MKLDDKKSTLKQADKDPLDPFYRGKIEIVGDIMAPIYTDEEWEAFFEAKWRRLEEPESPDAL